ncbi:sporulation related domain protein [Formosa agariphila KMM 3901]|uniref:Sporulation related domain protein n=1 Tax=Formosa agariphila (strain DSM 15362 / KCTC 12365 / LMG 23005 / KMM 3901 / M-2Alg 35-1) TaxID=1347342 RepID=T2KGK5_FORAG|nr:sporulation related domain protein [Formosa agariphila KMM 3901]
MKFKIIAFTGFCVFTLSTKTFAQQGSIAINQDDKIKELLDVKKEMNKDENATDRFKIQLYSGNRADAEDVLKEYNGDFNQWEGTLVYETPNYKIWVGSYRTRLEADRALTEIKTKYPNGFIFKPKAKS